MSGSYAYVAAYDSDSLVVVLLDLHSPPPPPPSPPPAAGSIVGSVASASLLDYALGVAVSGSYAYVTAAWSDSLVVIDVSNPASPVIRGSVLSSSLMDGVRVTQSSVARMASGAAHAPSPSMMLASAAPPPVDSLSRSHSLALTCCAHRRMASP